MIDKGLTMPFERKANLFQKINNIPELMGILFFMYISFQNALFCNKGWEIIYSAHCHVFFATCVKTKSEPVV